jgi:hypothetical protein
VGARPNKIFVCKPAIRLWCHRENMAKPIHICGWALFAVFLYGPVAQAQETDPAKNDPREQPVAPYVAPLPAGRTSVLVLNSPLGQTEAIQVAGNDRPLSGVQAPTLGPIVGARNFLVPSFSATSQMATSSSSAGIGRPTDFNYLLGSLDLNHVTNRSELLVHYAGGGMFSSYLNSAIQDLQFSYNYKWQRWSMLLGDDVSFLSESPFGFGGVGGLEFLGGNSPFGPGGFLNGILGPNQTIPTIMVPRLSNTFVSQIEYNVSPRSSWTASGSYGTLNFMGVGYINSADALFQTGYNYSLSPASTIAVIYRFDDYRFTKFPQSIGDHVVKFGYARYVTGRLSFQVAAGPSVVMLHGIFTGSSSNVSWALDSALNYKWDRTTLLFSYDHLVTGGSGVLVGAQTGQAEASLERKLNPRWRALASLGYATNTSLIPTSIISSTRHYNSWYAGVRFNHELRPGTNLFVGYNARLQTLNSATCTTPNCGGNFIAHEISAGFNFSLRPILFR